MYVFQRNNINDLVVPRQFAQAVTKLNILIHRYELLQK